MSKFKKILVDSFGMSEAEFTDQQPLMQLKDFDSMSHMLFVTKLEEQFGIELTGDEIIGLEKIGDVRKLLISKNIDPSI